MTLFASSAKGEFRQATLSHPLTIKAGDIVDRIGNQVIVTRAGVIVGTATISATSTPISYTAGHADTINKAIFFKETPVPGQSVVLTRVTENSTSGIVTFWYSNGSSTEYGSWADVGSQLGSLDQQPELAEKILAYKSFVNSPDGTNKTTMIDVNCAINFEAGTPIALIEV